MHDAGGSLQLILSLALRHGDTFEVVPAVSVLSASIRSEHNR
jgi:hypothetical protein